MIHTVPKWIQKLLHKRVWSISTTEKKIYLTFDDGPCETTQGLLSLLSKYDAKATFFCLGKNITKHPELYQQMKDEGHAIANHGYDHLNGWKYKSKTDNYIENIQKAAPLTSDLYFRPAYGKTTLKQRKEIRKLGYKIIMWTFNSGDYKKDLNTKKAIKAAKVSSQPGSIFLFHDSLKAQQNTLIVLKELLPYWKENGFKLVPIY